MVIISQTCTNVNTHAYKLLMNTSSHDKSDRYKTWVSQGANRQNCECIRLKQEGAPWWGMDTFTTMG